MLLSCRLFSLTVVYVCFIYVLHNYANSIVAHEDSVVILTVWKATYFIFGLFVIYLNSEVWLVVLPFGVRIKCRVYSVKARNLSVLHYFACSQQCLYMTFGHISHTLGFDWS
jgi:hypothetical protein